MKISALAVLAAIGLVQPAVQAQSASDTSLAAAAAVGPKGSADPIAGIVGQLDLERYKATIKALTQFGDRRQGTDRNRAAVDWIEAQLKSYGYTTTARIHYDYFPADPRKAPKRAMPFGADSAQGGGRYRGIREKTGVVTDPLAQPDVKLRELNAQHTTIGPREEVYCTKVGTTRPNEMYIISAHMDGHGWGEAANDDGSGTALVMEIARLLAAPGVKTGCSIRFAFWNNEETGLDGAKAYVAQRAPLQGKEDPEGSGLYPEPKWLGMIQHDMMLFDHGMPKPDGTLAKEQRPEADVNIEFQMKSKCSEGSQKLAWAVYAANESYATDYPAAVGPHMTNTDSDPFMDLIPAISLREAERGREIGAGWDPQCFHDTATSEIYTDADFRLGLNAAQTTLGAVLRLAGLNSAR